MIDSRHEKFIIPIGFQFIPKAIGCWVSSPKSSSYRVNAQATREALERARKRAKSQLSELEKVHAKVAELADRYRGDNLGIDLSCPTPPDDAAGFSRIEAYRQELQDLCRERESALVSAEARIKTRRILGALVGKKKESLQTINDVAPDKKYSRNSPEKQQGNQTPAFDPKMVQDKLERRIAGLDSLANIEDRKKIDTIISRLESASSALKADIQLLDLTKAVQDANDGVAAYRKDRDQARELLDQLGPLPGSKVELARRALLKVEEGSQILDSRLRHLVAEAIKAGESQYAEQVLNSVLEEMGYEVEEEFQTLFAEGGTIHFSRPAWREYSVRLRVSPSGASLNYNMVREGQGELEQTHEQALRDKEMEEAWCPEFDQLQTHLNRAGVICRTQRRLGAGQLPVQVRKTDASAKKDSRRRREIHPAQKEREK